MTKKTLEQLQEKHSHLCFVAADLGLSVPEDLTIDFDSTEVGSTVVSNLESLIRKFKDGIDQKDVAGAADSGHPDKPTKPKKTGKSKPRAEAKPAEGAKQVGESKMATAKKPKSKKVAAKKAVAKKTAKVAKTKTVKKNGGSHKTDKIVAMLKRSGGCTREQVLEATGWPSISMQALAKSTHLKLKVDKSERPFRYSA